MNRTLRLAMLVLAAGAALAFAGNALATQRLAVSQSSSSLTIKVSQDQSDAQPAKITIYVPTGYQLNATQAPGTKIGTTSGQVFARDVSIPLPLTGDVVVADPAQHTKDACSPGTHIAVWILQLSVAGQTINLPVYVTGTSGTEAGIGAVKLEVCLGPADVPMGTPGRSPQGAQLLQATFTVENTITPPTGPAQWTSFWTPYAAGSPLPNPAGTVEARAIVGPGAVSLRAKVVNRRKKIVRLSGAVTQSGDAVTGAKVSLLINSRTRFSTKSNASGAFAFRLQNTNRRKTTTFFQALATVGDRDLGSAGCANPTQPPIPCVSATAGGFTARSVKVRVRI